MKFLKSMTNTTTYPILLKSLTYSILFSLTAYAILPYYLSISVSIALILYSLTVDRFKLAYELSSNIILFLSLGILAFEGKGYVGLIVQSVLILVFLLWLRGFLLFRSKINRYLFLLSSGISAIFIYFFSLKVSIKAEAFGFILLWASNVFSLFIDIRQSGANMKDNLRYYNPPWMLYSFLPVGSRFLRDSFVSNQKLLLVSQKNGVQLATALMGLHLILVGFFQWCRLNGANFDINLMSTTSLRADITIWLYKYLSTRYNPTFSSWVILYLGSLLSISRIILLYGYSVALGRMFGFNLPLFPFSWKKVISIRRLYAQILFYYNKMLIDTFFIPLFKFFKNINQPIREKIVIFITFSIGGTIAHTIFNLRSLPLFPTAESVLQKSLDFSKYSTVLALFLIFSPRSSEKEVEISLIKFLMKLFVAITVYAIIFRSNISFYREHEGYKDFLNYFFILFGLKKS